jgi:uncharacterized membrane protein YgcG
MSTIVSRLVAVAAVIAGVLALAPGAGAAISPSLSLNQSAGKTAGSLADLGMDLKFTDTNTDSPRNLTINLPPGLLANAAINGGSCLKTTQTSGTACEVGSGTVTATPNVLIGLPVPVPVPVKFYLVPPPKPGDLAGLTVIGTVVLVNEQLGSTGDIRVRPTGDPHGVGVTIGLTLPDTLPGLSLPGLTLSVTEINSTFNHLRYPATCPSTPAPVTATVDSYKDATLHSLSAPLSVTGCSSLPFSPAFKVTATRDSTDRQVKLATTITQGASEAPSRSVTLAFRTATLAPNLASIQALCLNLASGTCTQVGSASATSPLYPATLTGKAYLTGNSSGLSLTLVFPSPFPLTLTGAVNLLKNAATFTGLPDIPLTNLSVSLNGGAQGLFLSTCATPSGTATAALTDQNGDKSTTVPANFTVSGCPGAGRAGSGSGGGSGNGGSGSGGGSDNGGSGSNPSGAGGARHNGSSAAGVTVGHTKLSRGRFTGLRSGHPALSFRVSVARGAAGLQTLTVSLRAGLSFLNHGHRPTGVSVRGAKVKSLSLRHGHLVITLVKPASAVTIAIGPGGLGESRSLRAEAKHHRLRTLGLALVAQNTGGQRTTVRARLDALPG